MSANYIEDFWISWGIFIAMKLAQGLLKISLQCRCILIAILDSVTVEDWVFAEGVVGKKWPLHQPSTSQESSCNPRWRHQTDLSSVPLRNNACAAGYLKIYSQARIIRCFLNTSKDNSKHVEIWISPKPFQQALAMIPEEFWRLRLQMALLLA